MPDDFRVSFTNAPGEASYPICGFTWILVYPKIDDPAKGKAIVDFLNWAMVDGQENGTCPLLCPASRIVWLLKLRITSLRSSIRSLAVL